MPNETQGQAPGQSEAPKVGFTLDAKAKTTIQWVAIFYVASRAVEFIIGWIGMRFFAGGGLLGQFASYSMAFPTSGFIRDMVWGAIWGVVFGFVIARGWSWFQQVNQRTFKFTSVFKFFFVWDVLLAVVLGVFLSFSVFFLGMMPLLSNIVGIIAGAFIFAKGFEAKLGGMYRL